MRYFRTQAFSQGFQSLSSQRQVRAEQALGRLDILLTKGERPGGLGLKQLRHGIWEIRAGLEDRILFRREKDVVQFLMVGNHNDIHRALKRL